LSAGCLGTAVDPAATLPPPTLVDAVAALEAGEPAANVHLLGEWRERNGAEADAWGDLLFVMSGSEVVVLNVSDPANLREEARVASPVRVLDVKVSDDGAFLFVGNDAYLSGAPKGGKGVFTGGLYAFDIRDLSAPKLVAYQPVGERRGPHMVFYHRMPDGRELVFGANADVSIHEFDREAGTFTELSRYQADLVTAFNRDPEVVDVLYQGWAHDMFVQQEPDGATLMYVANWDAGLRIVDVTDPARPRELGGWNDFPKGHEGNLHTVAADWVDGRRLVVGSTEVGFAVVGGLHYAMGTDRSIAYVWDATDPAKPTLLGYWENPLGLPAGRDQDVFGEEITSTHNLQLEGGRVYLAHYGLGVFVLDVSTPDQQAQPATLAYYQEDDLNVWDVVLSHGVVYASGTGGIRALHYAPDVLGHDGLFSRA
ncbi:MAG TPA: hypothetical protein VNX21_06075, partial [Candidatus Thermoplasmatota archaeon]|nr:hypothetical protein [Candidatus Thermoplasmatota archaeon]